MVINQEMRERVYQKFNGHCAYCGKEIDYKDMQLDHLIPQCILENNKHQDLWDKVETFENYMPSCRRCNHYKRGNSLETFREMIRTIPQKLMRDNYIYKVASDFRIVPIQSPQEIEFYFEKVDDEFNLGKPIYNIDENIESIEKINSSITDVFRVKRYYASLHYGTVNPFVVGLWMVCQNMFTYEMYYFRISELFYNSRYVGRQLTDEEYYQLFKDFISKYDIEALIIDPAAASFIQTLNRHKDEITYGIIKANNDIQHSIKTVSKYLAEKRLIIGDNCVNGIEQLRNYRWEKRKNDRLNPYTSQPLSPVPVCNKDQCCRDIGYFINYVDSQNTKGW